MPAQSMGEWKAYLEFIETYFRNREIEKPIVVEIGVGYGKQKRYYEEILGYTHIGIDVNAGRKPDIMGNSRSTVTVDRLKERLNGQPVNLLFLDGGHAYETVKRDYELYSPLVKNIIAIHDIVLEEHQADVGKFWNELIAEAKERKIPDKTFIVLMGFYTLKKAKIHSFGPGTGLILLEDMNG